MTARRQGLQRVYTSLTLLRRLRRLMRSLLTPRLANSALVYSEMFSFCIAVWVTGFALHCKNIILSDT